jgi:hypothetical protein
MRFEAAFQKAFGRAPTLLELERVRLVVDAFEVRDNDALVSIAGLLEFYGSESRETLKTCTVASRAMQDECADAIRRTLDDWLSASGRLLVDAVGSTIDRRLEMGAVKYAAAARQAMTEARAARAPSTGARSQRISASDWVMLFALLVLYSVFFGISCLLLGAMWAWQPALFGSALGPVGWILVLDVLVLVGVWGHRHQRLSRE